MAGAEGTKGATLRSARHDRRRVSAALLRITVAFGALVVSLALLVPSSSAASTKPPPPTPPRLALNATLVRDILPGSAASSPQHLTNVDGTLFFTANDPSYGVELWRTDGTAEGTRLVRDLRPGRGSSSPHDLIGVNRTLFFRADDGSHGDELWKSDGTAASATLVRDIQPGGSGSDVAGCSVTGRTSFVSLNGKLYFVANDGIHGDQLWRSDGSATGTAPITGFYGSYGWRLCDLTTVGGRLFFTDRVGTYSGGAWTSDGTAAGTRSLRLPVQPNLAWLPDFTDANGIAFFQASWGSGIGMELAKSDGTRDGTALVTDINPGAGWSYPVDLTNAGGQLFFGADDGTHGYELWRSDGTTAGTALVKDIKPGAGGTVLNDPTNVNGVLLFGADDGTNGIELWRSDGTAAGTALVKDTKPGASSPSQLTDLSAKLFFTADDGIHGTELWAFPTRQPDAQIALPGDSTLLGSHVWNTSGSMQTRHTAVTRGHSRTFTIRVQNDGLRADSFHVRGCGTSNGFVVSYRRGRTDITPQVTSGIYTTGSLNPGAYRVISAIIRARPDALLWTTKTCSIKAISLGDTTQSDLVKAAVSVSAG